MVPHPDRIEAHLLHLDAVLDELLDVRHLGNRLDQREYPHLTFGDGPDKTVRYFPDKLPIGVLPTLGIVRVERLRSTYARHVIAPILVELTQDFEFFVFREIQLVSFRLTFGLIARW